MSPEGTGGSNDNKSIGMEFDRTQVVSEVKNTLVDARFLDKTQSEDEVASKVASAFGVLNDKFGSEYTSMAEVVEAVGDEKTPEQKKALEYKKIMEEAVAEAAIESTDGLAESMELFLGSDHVTNMMPNGLKEVGRFVAEQFVPDKNIDNILNQTEEAREDAARGGRGSKITLVQEIDRAVASLDSHVPQQRSERMVWRSAKSALNGERDELAVELGFSNNLSSGVRMVEQPQAEPKKPRASKPQEKNESGDKRVELTMKQQLQILIDNSVRIKQSIDNGEGMTSEQAERFIEGINQVAQNTSEDNGATPEQITSLVQNIDRIAKKVGQGGMTKAQISGMVKNIEIIAEKVSDGDGSTKEQMATALEILGQISESARKTAQEAQKANEKLSEKMDGMAKITQQQIVSDEVKKYIENAFISAGDQAVDASKLLREVIEMFKGKLEYAGDAMVLAADVFMETIGKFEKSTLDVIKAQARLVEVTKKIAEMESYGELSTDDLLKIIQETRGPMSDEEKVRETAKGRLDESANLSALLFVGKLPPNFKELYNKMSPDLKAYWDRKIEQRKANLEAIKGSGADPAVVDALYREMEGLLSSRSGGGERGERGEKLKANFDDIEKWLLEIETSNQPSNDISLNSNKLRDLYAVINGEVKVEGINNAQERERLVAWIKSRLFINDWFLSASTSHSIEDMFKTTARVHQGDVDQNMDVKLLKTTLDTRERIKGLEIELPVAEAWNLRQLANIEYAQEVSGGVVTKGYLLDTWNKHKSFIMQQLGKDEAGSREIFLTVGDPLMKKNEKRGIDKDYYTTLRNDKSLVRKKIVEMCMARELEKYIIVGGDKSEAEKSKKRTERAIRAVELAKRESVIFYQESVANIAFADADDYAEIVNFKFICYQDMLEAANSGQKDIDSKEGPKNKPLGYDEIVGRIDSLTPTYLQTLMYKDKAKSKNSVFSTLLAEDLNFDKMDPKSSMLYHLGSIVFKKVLPTQQMFLKSTTYKDLSAPQEIYRKYDQLNKTITEAASKGWNLLNLERNDMTEKTPLENKERLFRALYVLSIFGNAISPEARGLDWGGANIEFARRMFTDYIFYGDDGKRSLSFIKRGHWEWIMEDVATIQTWDGGKFKIRGFGLRRQLKAIHEENQKIQKRYSGK